MDGNPGVAVPLQSEWEEALVRRCQAGDHGAFADLFASYHEDVCRFAFQVVRDAGLAQDAAQEAFIKVYRAIGNFGFRSSFRSWLYRVAVNEGINLLRRGCRREEPTLPPRGPLPRAVPFLPPEEAALAAEARWTLQGALARLDPHHRQALVLKYYRDLSDAEIARVLRCPVGTVKSRLHRARELLRRDLARRLPPESGRPQPPPPLL